MPQRSLAFHTLDVFTTTRFAGNPLAVVTGADELGTDAMQAVAREFNLSETVFVSAPDDERHEASVRIFTPTHEMPFAGHPTIGCAILLAERHWPKGRIDEVLVLEEKAGLVPVRVEREGPGHAPIRASLTAPVTPTPRGEALDPRFATEGLGLPADAVREDHPVRVHEGGPSFLYVPLRDAEALGAARPAGAAFEALTAAAGCGSVYAYALESGEAVGEVHARMFAPDAGIVEDPATGSAAAILASQLLGVRALGEGTTSLDVRQGVEMGRPSEIGLEIDVEAGALAAVRVSGRAVRVMDGQIIV